MQEKQKVILVWYKRDLRISDHKPLTEAMILWRVKNIPIIAVYSFEPCVTLAPDFSDFHRQFLEDSLTDLMGSLKTIWVSLIIFERNISDVMKYILEYYDVEKIFSHEETGNAITYHRDIMMGKYLGSKKIPWIEYPTNWVVRRLRSRDDWSKIWESRMRETIVAPPEWQAPFVLEIRWDTWQRNIGNTRIQRWGEKEWQKTLATFLVTRGKRYMGGMSRPIEGQEASSRISTYLAYGCVSLRQVVQMTWVRMHDLKTRKVPGISQKQEIRGNKDISQWIYWSVNEREKSEINEEVRSFSEIPWDAKFLRSLQAFHSRLHWQSHFIQKLEDEPRLESMNAVKLYDSIRTEYDDDIMTAIENARTGVPFIDGIVRQLHDIGWVNFRARATLVSFVTCTCMQPWQGRFAHWLARLFTDYEPGIHYMQLQMQSGTMGINTIRIYNPMKQLHDKDSDGLFVDAYLPELAKLPKHLQSAPWEISEMESIEYGFVLGRDYPHPIVDVEVANRSARAILYDMKAHIDPRVKSAIVAKHASRKWVTRKKSQKKEKENPDTNLSLFD
jgi:deoxyribodipyrimidine photo-lyase